MSHKKRGGLTPLGGCEGEPEETSTVKLLCEDEPKETPPKKLCLSCGKVCVKIKKCADCKSGCYCSRQCRATHVISEVHPSKNWKKLKMQRKSVQFVNQYKYHNMLNLWVL